MRAAPALPMDAAPLVPQMPPMRLVTRLLSVTGTESLAESMLQPDSPFAGSNGDIISVAFIEMAAQSCAAAWGYTVLGGAPAREGYLVGVKEFRCLGRARVGECLHICIRTVAELEGFLLVDAAIRRAQAPENLLLAYLRLKVYCPPSGLVTNSS